MLLQPLQSRRTRRQVAKTKSFSPPVKGWISDNDFAANVPRTALVLDNWVTTRDSVYVRNGTMLFDTLPDPVETLMSFRDGGLTKMLAAAGGNIYEAIQSASVSIQSGLSNDRWQHVSMANAADEVALVMVNGADGIYRYDSAGISKVTPTPDITDLIGVTNHKGRLWFVRQGSSVLYYGDPLSNNPTTLTPYPAGALMKFGGSFVAIETWSRDGGAGPDDYLVAVTNRGEILVFAGLDPGDANDWRLVGSFKHQKPLGNRCLRKVGSDVMYLGSYGPVSIQTLLPSIDAQATSPIPIRDAFEKYEEINALAFGWDMRVYSAKSWMIVNIPVQPPSVMYQFILNLDTGAWFSFSGWNALCWEEHDNKIYYGDQNGNIFLADFGKNDNGEYIKATWVHSWNEFGSARQKQFGMVQLTTRAGIPPAGGIGMLVDYSLERNLTYPGYPALEDSSLWDIALWDEAEWAGGTQFYSEWNGVTGIGFVGAFVHEINVKDYEYEVFGFRVAYKEGEVL